jgi:large subunit ribosomal protein L4
MTTIATYDVAKGASGEREFSADLGEKVLFRTMKEAIVQFQANKRQGDAHTKVRSELAGHKKKPWKQKKTGRARAGDRRSPLWVGGATVFGPRNTRRWSYHLPRKQRLVALRSALAGKLQDNEIKELQGFSIEAPSSKAIRKVVADCAPQGTVLLMTASHNDVVYKSARNFPQVNVCAAADANAYDLLAHKWILAEAGALEVLAERCALTATTKKEG